MAFFYDYETMLEIAYESNKSIEELYEQCDVNPFYLIKIKVDYTPPVYDDSEIDGISKTEYLKMLDDEYYRDFKHETKEERKIRKDEEFVSLVMNKLKELQKK